MNKKQITIFLSLVGVFLFAYLMDFSNRHVQDAIMEGFYMLQWYARCHTLPCVVPAMFIAGAIATFFSKEAVLRHLGPKANKVEAYGVASTSGTVLAVCSCSVLPMFAGIYRVGAGLGPASAFLYSGPAINVMAIFLTARVLGYELGIARIIGSIGFAVVIG
ncbi:MAG: permease, partial [Planctomycetota bacterium]|nr:permease [Planctomycetota bacterium]